jgi:biotin synthase-related radical SAM superfamily protein
MIQTVPGAFTGYHPQVGFCIPNKQAKYTGIQRIVIKGKKTGNPRMEQFTHCLEVPWLVDPAGSGRGSCFFLISPASYSIAYKPSTVIMKKIPLTPELKSLLISIGSADIDGALLPAESKIVSTAGPSAGSSSFFISSGGHRVRLSINRNSPIKAVKWEDGVALMRDGDLVVTGTLEEPLCHCPGQAYITICERCIYDCKFCPVPKLQGQRKDIPTILMMVGDAYERGGMKAISLTSGVEISPDDEVKKTVEVVKELKKHFSVPIGVSVCPTETSSEELREAGASEIKYNVETMDPEIFSRVCPGLSLKKIFNALDHAVLIFGKNHVFSNFIIGLGETDEAVEKGVEDLAKIGVIPILRPVSASPYRAGEIEIQRPTPERLQKLARMEKAVLEKYHLDASKATTMCLPCTGCDIAPYCDV